MIPKERKLNKEHFRLLRGGIIVHSPHLTLRVHRLQGGEQSRASFVVSSKISGKSTERNKMKRGGYRVIKDLFPRIRSGLALVFFFKKGAAEIKARAIQDEITSLLLAAHALQAPL